MVGREFCAGAFVEAWIGLLLKQTVDTEKENNRGLKSGGSHEVRDGAKWFRVLAAAGIEVGDGFLAKLGTQSADETARGETVGMQYEYAAGQMGQTIAQVRDFADYASNGVVSARGGQQERHLAFFRDGNEVLV
jgi:hypothetical protein